MTLPLFIPDYSEFAPGKTSVLYSGPFWNQGEINAAIRALTEGKWLTAGEEVAKFQRQFAKRFNVEHAHMVNSGSSANLVMIAALKKALGWKNGDEIICSPVGFPTTIAPIIQCGLRVVFADIELDTLNFDLNQVERAITPRTRGIFISPVLGNPPNIDRLLGMGKLLIGDNCDSLGTLWHGQLWTDFCYAWSTSFYGAHHLCTGEGGMVCCDDKEIIDLAQSFSWWGRSCYCVGAANTLPCGTCKKRFSNWLGDDTVVDHKYVFDNMGYNLKPLDLQGAIGLEQLKKFDEIERKRREHFKVIAGFFAGNERVRVARTEEGADPSWFGVPLICDSQATKESLVQHFEAHKIQTRPYFAGNLLRHPAYRHLANADKFPFADCALKRVFFLGCPPHYNSAVLAYIGDVFRKW